MKNLLKSIFILSILLLLSGCNDTNTPSIDTHNKTVLQTNDTREDDDHGEEDDHEEGGNSIELRQDQLDVMGIELGEIKPVSLGSSLKVNGQLELPPQRMASVSAIIGGRVKDVYVIEGDKVKKGQVIARLSNPEFITMQQEYLSAKSAISFLEKDFLRKKELLKDGITSQKSFQQAEAAFLEGKSNLNATKSTLRLMGININSLNNGQIVSSIPVLAPINGYIQNVEINIGKYISSEQEMFEIVDNDHLHLGLKVFEKDIDKVKVGQKIAFSLTTRPNTLYAAEIFALGKSFDMDTRAVKVHAKIVGNHEGLLTGMFVDARISLDDNKVMALPDEAFVTEKGLDYIFVQTGVDEDGILLEKIRVNKGVSDLGFSEVIFKEPLAKNTKIVLKGAYYVNSELGKGEFEGHEH